MFRISSSSTVCDIMKENKLLTIDQLLTKELIVFMFKQKNGKKPIAFKDIFTKNESKYNTSSKSFFISKKCSSIVLYVSKLFHTVVQHVGIAFLST